MRIRKVVGRRGDDVKDARRCRRSHNLPFPLIGIVMTLLVLFGTVIAGISGASALPMASSKPSSLAAATPAETVTRVGSISGRVTAADTGLGLANVAIYVYSLSNQDTFTDGGEPGYTGVTTAADGTYTVGGLGPTDGPYVVCFDTSGAPSGGSATGYVDQCSGNISWDGPVYTADQGAQPFGTGVQVAVGSVTTGVDAALPVGGSISGTITGAGTGSDTVLVDVFDSDTDLVGSASTTDAAGDYTVLGLAASASGYSVCFFPSYADTGQCYRDVADNSGAPGPYNIVGIPPGTVTVPVAAGSVTSGIDANLTVGSISGTVTATGGGGLDGVSVSVADSAGQFIGSATTAANGTYTLSGLLSSAAGYSVCFELSTAGYGDQCYGDVAWNGATVPNGSTLVPVAGGAA